MPPQSSPQTRVLLLRHAETSAPERFHGAESDIGLSPRGLNQAGEAARVLSSLRPAALYCSGMRRAIETATVIGQALNLEPIAVPMLHERIMGPLSGSLRAETHHLYETVSQQWQAGVLDATHPGGESYRQIFERVGPAFLAIAEAHAGSTIVVVAHGVVIRVLITAIVDELSPADLENIRIDFVGVHDLRMEGRSWSLVRPDGSQTAQAPFSAK